MPSTRQQKNRELNERVVLAKVGENSMLCDNSYLLNQKNLLPIRSEKNSVEAAIFDPTDGFDGLSPEHMRSLIDDLEIEIRRRIDAINEEREKARNVLQQQCRVMMFKFSPAIRKMTIGEFFDNYGIDLKTLDFDLKNTSTTQLDGGGKRVKLLSGETSSSSSYSRFATPSRLPNFTRKLTTPGSALRSARYGEKV